MVVLELWSWGGDDSGGMTWSMKLQEMIVMMSRKRKISFRLEVWVFMSLRLYLSRSSHFQNSRDIKKPLPGML